MESTTTFGGSFAVIPPLRPRHREYLVALDRPHRTLRDPEVTRALPDSSRERAGIGIGPDGATLVGPEDDHEFAAPSLEDDNKPATGQPSSWCGWIPNEEGTAIFRDGAERLDRAEKSLAYSIEHFGTTWGHDAPGEIHRRGVREDNRGTTRLPRGRSGGA